MKKIIWLLLLLPVLGTAQIDALLNKAKTKVTTKTASTNSASNLSGLDISGGLKEALSKGIERQVSKLTATDGFNKNQAVKILFPEELKRVEKALRSAGLGNLADEGIVSLNRAAEDAVKQATPVFVSAVKNMSITDAKSILLGNSDAATNYLKSTTSKELYSKFSPVVKSSIGKVGADKVWSKLISKYNTLPLVSKINPDLTDHVTTKALDGVFTMIAVEEKDIRSNLNARTTTVLQKVFAAQDKK